MPIFSCKGLMRPYAVDAHTQHLRIQLLEALHVIHKADVLVGAHRAPVERVENDNHVFLALKVRELDFLLILALASAKTPAPPPLHGKCHAPSSSNLPVISDRFARVAFQRATHHIRRAPNRQTGQSGYCVDFGFCTTLLAPPLHFKQIALREIPCSNDAIARR